MHSRVQAAKRAASRPASSSPRSCVNDVYPRTSAMRNARTPAPPCACVRPRVYDSAREETTLEVAGSSPACPAVGEALRLSARLRTASRRRRRGRPLRSRTRPPPRGPGRSGSAADGIAIPRSPQAGARAARSSACCCTRRGRGLETASPGPSPSVRCDRSRCGRRPRTAGLTPFVGADSHLSGC